MAGQTSEERTRAPAALRAWVGRDALVAFALSRAVVWGAGLVALAVSGVVEPRAERYDPEDLTDPFGGLGDALVAPGARWDAVWFLRIAEDGYAPDADRAAFFPLYPLIVKVLGALVGSPLVAGILVSLGCLLGALVLLHRLVVLDFGARVARTTVLLVAVFPGALWLSSVYSEALFLLLSVAAVLWARTDRWALAGAAGALAAMTRSAGVVLLVPLVLLWWRSERRPRDLAWTALVPAGLLAVCLVAVAAGHGFTAPFDAQAAWLRSFAGPLGAIPAAVSDAWDGAGSILRGEERPAEPFDPAWMNVGLLASLVLVLVAVVGAVRRVPLPYAAYAACALVLPLSYPVEGQPLMSLPRFASVLWPLALWAALVLDGRPRLRAAVLAVSLAGLALVSGHVARWGWVA